MATLKIVEGSGSESGIYYITKKDSVKIDQLLSMIHTLGKSEHSIEIDITKIKSKDLKALLVSHIYLAFYRYRENGLLANVKIIGDIHKGSKNIAQIINECRFIIDSPANIMNGDSITHFILQENNPKIKCQVIDENELRNLGLHGILAINQASSIPARMLVLETGPTSEPPIVLIGKGVIFDSGGINLKHGDFSDMKSDKTGAIYVWGLMKALSLESDSKRHFIGIMPLVENMPGGNAIHPGDVVQSCNGKKIEITNTDAEGRIILADAMCWAQTHIPNIRLIIDIATLTGQAASIFGGLGCAAMCNQSGQSSLEGLMKTGDQWYEYFWQLPLHRRFQDKLVSNVADIKNLNIGFRADTIMGGMYLKEFVDEKIPWIHLDIAGVAYREQATGEPMLSLYHYLASL